MTTTITYYGIDDLRETLDMITQGGSSLAKCRPLKITNYLQVRHCEVPFDQGFKIICDAIEQNESEVENFVIWFLTFSIRVLFKL